MKRLFTFLFLIGVCVRAEANTITATSASLADVGQAITNSSNGDTIIIPAGTNLWTATLTIPTAKTLNILGAGGDAHPEYVCIQKTNSGACFFITGNPSRIHDVWFSMLDTRSSTARAVDGYGSGFRVDHFLASSPVLTDIGLIAGQVSGVVASGVFDHFTWTNCATSVNGSGNQTFAAENPIWALPNKFGTTNAVYFEHGNSYFTVFGDFADANIGGSYVMRYCYLQDGEGPAAHSDQGLRGAKSWEIYGNTIAQVNRGVNSPFLMRSGTGVICSNTITGTWTHPSAVFDNVRSYSSRGFYNWANGNASSQTVQYDGTNNIVKSTATAGSSGTTLIDSTKTWTAGDFTTNGLPYWVYNLTDGSRGGITTNTATTLTVTNLTGGSLNVLSSGDAYYITDGYPARDQIGTGPDISLWTTTNTIPGQTHETAYVWANTYNGASNNNVYVGVNPGGSLVGVPDNNYRHIQLNRDYVIGTPKPGYTPLPDPFPYNTLRFPDSDLALTTMTNVTIAQDTATAALPFTISGGLTNAGSYTIAGASSNPSLVPTINIVFGGSSSNRTATLTPLASQYGVSTITITVTDQVGGTYFVQFLLTVTQTGVSPPTITAIANQSATVLHSTGAIAFTVGDSATALTNLIVTAVSSDQAIVADNAIMLGGTAGPRTISLVPQRDGAFTMTVTVRNDGAATCSTNFSVAVSGNARPSTTRYRQAKRGSAMRH